MWSAQRDGDFLGAIFHLFDSEDSEDEVEAREAEAVVVKEGKKEGSKFTPGFWNVTEGAELEISQSNGWHCSYFMCSLRLTSHHPHNVSSVSITKQ